MAGAQPVLRPAARAATTRPGAGERALTGTSPEAAALLDEAFGTEPG